MTRRERRSERRELAFADAVVSLRVASETGPDNEFARPMPRIIERAADPDTRDHDQ